MINLRGYGIGCGQGPLGAVRKQEGQQAIGQGAERGSGQGIGRHGMGAGQLFGKGMRKHSSRKKVS